MKKHSILFLLLIFSFYCSSSNARAITNDPGYKVTVYTREGYRLVGLLISSTDSQLLIYPGKYKDWKKKVKCRTVYYHFSKIERLQLKKTSSLAKYPHKGDKETMFMVNGDLESFRLLRKSLLQ